MCHRISCGQVHGDVCRWFVDTPEAYGAFTKRQRVTKLQCFSSQKNAKLPKIPESYWPQTCVLA